MLGKARASSGDGPRIRFRALCTAGVATALAALAAADVAAQARLWINLYWLACAIGALGVSLVGLRRADAGRLRARRAVALMLGTYSAGQIVWGIQVAAGWPVVPGPSDAFFLAAPLPIIWAALSAFEADLTPVTRRSVRLDALALALAIVSVTLLLVGRYAAQLGALEAAVLLLYPVLYVAPAGAILIGALAIALRPGLFGVWMVLAGFVLLGTCFSTWTANAIAGVQPVGTIADYLFGLGLLLVGIGGATWSDARETSARLVRGFRILADTLPVLAVLVTVGVTIGTEVGAGYGGLSAVTLAALLATAGLRHVLLMRSQRQDQEALRALATRLGDLEEEKRLNVAAYMHDDIAQHLAVARMKFNLLDKTEDPDEAATIRHDVDALLLDTIDNVRSTMFELYPFMLFDNGIVATVRHHAQILAERSGLQVRIADDGEDKPLDRHVAIALYRFVCELLANVIEHARVDEATVTFERSDGTVVVAVMDDGVGMHEIAWQASERFGLHGIRERCRAMGLTFRIDSHPGAGTRATIRAPLSRRG